jgi:hypothetical protein
MTEFMDEDEKAQNGNRPEDGMPESVYPFENLHHGA